jgi:hypothetical protein
MRWYSAVMGSGIVFAGPQEYVPVFVAATMILLLDSPRTRCVLGPFASGLERGLIEFDILHGRSRVASMVHPPMYMTSGLQMISTRTPASHDANDAQPKAAAQRRDGSDDAERRSSC